MLLETICIQNGAIQHLSYHQRRLNRSQEAFFEDFEPIDLGQAIHPPSTDGTIKCRVLYAQRLLDVHYEPYRPRKVETLRLVEADDIDYAYKYSMRDALESLLERRGNADDILIVKKGLVTDTSIANIAFLKNRRWYTPKTPLLAGTTRERLVRSGFLLPRNIAPEEIDDFEAFALLNAMIGFVPIKRGRIVR